MVHRLDVTQSRYASANRSIDSGAHVAKSVLIAYSSPTSAAEEDAFNDWYDNTHIDQVRAGVPGITTVSRYRVFDPAGVGGVPRYVAIYEIDEDDVSAAAAALGAAAATGKLDPTTTMDVTTDPPVLVFGQGV
jgi:hypothetical protein